MSVGKEKIAIQLFEKIYGKENKSIKGSGKSYMLCRRSTSTAVSYQCLVWNIQEHDNRSSILPENVNEILKFQKDIKTDLFKNMGLFKNKRIYLKTTPESMIPTV